jgi:hypothetical protein
MKEFECDRSIHKLFGESTYYNEGDGIEKVEARKYLEHWKKNLLYKLTKDSCKPEVVDEQWGDRPSYLNGCLDQKAMMYLKICVKGKWNYELT